MTQTGVPTSARSADVVPAQHRYALPVVLIGAFMAILDTFIVLVASPAIQSNLHASGAQLQFILAGYQLSYAIVLITSGRLGDLYGRKRLFMTGMAVFVLSSIACAMAPDAPSLIAARLVQGVGAALMFPQVLSMIQVLVPAEQRHKAFGTLGAVIGLSTISGQLIGGALIAANLFGESWRPVFWVNVPVGIVTLALVARVVPETRAPVTRRLDLAGVAVLSLALFLLVVPLIDGRDAGWPLWTWLSFAGSLLAFVAFVVTERRLEIRGGDPLVAVRLFTQRAFAVGIALVMVAYAGLNSFFLVLSLTLQDGLGLSAMRSGLVYTPEAVTFFVVSIAAGKLVPRYGRRILEIGGVLLALGFAGTLLVAQRGAGLGAGWIIPTLVLQGLGGGLLITPLLNTVLSRMKPSEVGMASGVLSTAQQVGGALGVAVIGVVFFDSLHPSPQGRVASFAHALGAGSVFTVVVALAAAVLIFALPQMKPAVAPQPDPQPVTEGEPGALN